MDYYVGIDVSLELSSVCIVDVAGKIVAETKVESHPDAIFDFLRKLGHSVERIGLEAGPLSQWLHAGLTRGGCRVLTEVSRVDASLEARLASVIAPLLSEERASERDGHEQA